MCSSAKKHPRSAHRGRHVARHPHRHHLVIDGRPPSPPAYAEASGAYLCGRIGYIIVNRIAYQPAKRAKRALADPALRRQG
jgi:hypothetical protein